MQFYMFLIVFQFYLSFFQSIGLSTFHLHVYLYLNKTPATVYKILSNKLSVNNDYEWITY